MTDERRVLIWMCVLVGINQLGFGAMIPSLPLYAQSFGVSASAIGMAIGVYGLARFFVAVPAGYISDSIGRRPMLAIGGLVSAIGNLWCAWATSYPEFIAARFIAGAGAGLIVTTGQIVLADITVPANRGRTLAIYQGTFLFAVGIGPFPGGLIAEHFGLRAPFLSYGVAALLASLVAWFAVKETRKFTDHATGTIDPSAKRPGILQQLRLFAGGIGFSLVCLIAFMNAVVRTGGLFSIIPVLARERLGVSVTAIGFGLMLGSVAGLIASYPGGWVADRYGRKAVIVPVTVATGASMLLFTYAPNYHWFILACLIWGISASVDGSAPAAYAADVAPPGMQGVGLGFFRMMGDAGYVIGPLSLGVIVDVYGANTALILSAILLVGVGLAFWIGAPESHRSRTKT
ncbi:MAG: MFS transporter [Hyphomicrobiaceae bacterium]